MDLIISWSFLAEPGYYEDGSFGIRLENVLICKEANAKFNFGDKGYLAFEHITWVSIACLISYSAVSVSSGYPNNTCFIIQWWISSVMQAPYQAKLIDTKLLTPVEIEWVNTYHSDCRRILEPYLNEQEKEWLRKATEPIAQSGWAQSCSAVASRA